MQFVNIHDAKTNLSKYLDQIKKDKEVIVICKNGDPIAQLTEYKPNIRKLGTLEGKIEISEDFNEPLSDEFWGE
ncbi:MAG: type II toxin-antitoxin system prevent-host-death family antitoxin [Proteobacteria bacterium]|nr:type II toxin-antitoxin system prevent-host-death family antitoxin [Pseudomonadota bacterium]